MSARITEDDLLALIEGELPAHRVPDVRAALEADPALRARVERMILDRNRLRALASQSVEKAPPGILDDALAAAARDALFDEDAERAERSRGRRTQMLVAAGIGVVLLVGWGGGMLWYVGPGSAERRQASTPMPGSTIRHAEMAAHPDFAPATPATDETEVAEVAEEETETDPMAALAEVWERLQSPDLGTDDDGLLSEFLAAARAADGLDQPARPASPEIASVSPEEAAPLLLSGRVRLVVDGEARPPAYASDDDSQRRIPQPPAPKRITLDVDEAQPESFVSDLAEAVMDLEKRVGRPVHIQILPESDPERASVRPKLEFDDVFWWLSDPASWRRGVLIEVPVRYATSEEPTAPEAG